ncbi:MAG: helix-turn-helix domain-containing protein [Oryzihumus sp.]
MGAPGDLGSDRHMVVSQRLRLRRRALGLTQKQVVTRLARLGVTTTNKAVSSLEHGTGLDLAKLPELAQALDCSVTWLLGLTDDPGSWSPDNSARPGLEAASPVAASSVTAAARRSWILGPLPPEG